MRQKILGSCISNLTTTKMRQRAGGRADGMASRSQSLTLAWHFHFAFPLYALKIRIQIRDGAGNGNLKGKCFDYNQTARRGSFTPRQDANCWCGYNRVQNFAACRRGGRQTAFFSILWLQSKTVCCRDKMQTAGVVTIKAIFLPPAAAASGKLLFSRFCCYNQKTPDATFFCRGKMLLLGWLH